MADNEIQKMIDDMKISIFNLENSYNQQKKQIDAVKNLISEIEGKFLANNENLENIELPSIEPIEEVTTVEENTEVVPEAPVESTEVAQETPVENTEVAQEAPVESTEVAQEAPVENTEVAQEAPVESTEVAQEVPVESTEVVQETPVESTEVVPEAPVESTEVVQETPVESTEVVQEAPVESTEVVQEAPVENITEEVVVASNQLDDATDEVVEAPKIEDIPAPENPISETPLIPNVENAPEESLSTTTDDKMTFKKEYDGADKAILVNESQLNKLKDSKSSQKELMDFGKKTEGTDVVLPVATAEADPRAQMEAMMAQVEEARAKNDMAKVEELLNKVSEMNSKQLVK